MLTKRALQGQSYDRARQQPIEPEFFERWLGLWHETAGEVFAPEQRPNSISRPSASPKA